MTKEGSPLHLAWYKRAHQDSAPKRIRRGYLSRKMESGIESELTVPLQSRSDESHTKKRINEFALVFCRVSFSNGSILSESQNAYVYPEHDFKLNAVKICEKQKVHSDRYRKCIDPDQHLFSQRNTRSLTNITTAPQRAVIPLNATTPKPTYTTQIPSSLVSSTLLPTTGGSPHPPSAPADNDPSNNAGPGWIFDEQYLLICAIGVACLLVVIVFFLLFCLCVLNKLCHKSGYCTCCV